MKLLLDENISWRLCKLLEPRYEVVVHVNQIGIGDSSSDATIWEYAGKHGHCIVTNDDDFHSLASTRGFPPKVILLRMGNQSTHHMAEVLLKHAVLIEQFISSADHGVLEMV